MNHTPGPWHLAADCVEADGPQGPRDITVATVTPGFGMTSAANGRLIAAAPDLLTELKRMIAMWEEAIGYEEDYIDMADAARAAIARAEGRKQ